MARWEPLVACSAASLHLAALASYFSTLVWRSVSMALVPHAKLHSREPDTSARSKRWHVLGDFVASRAASPRGAAVTAPIPVLLLKTVAAATRRTSAFGLFAPVHPAGNASPPRSVRQWRHGCAPTSRRSIPNISPHSSEPRGMTRGVQCRADCSPARSTLEMKEQDPTPQRQPNASP